MAESSRHRRLRAALSPGAALSSSRSPARRAAALRLVRSRAKEWNLDPKRIGIWGFSAGGHLASTVATHFDEGKPDADDPIERVSCRPDFAILCYPVITMRPPFTHGGSRRNLLGDKPDEALVASLCNDEQVTEKTPPTFLFHTNEDTAVPPENSILFYQALRKKKCRWSCTFTRKGRMASVWRWSRCCVRLAGAIGRLAENARLADSGKTRQSANVWLSSSPSCK